MDLDNDLHYELRLMNTQSATGYFACVPEPEPGLDRGLKLLKERPFDDFLRKHLLNALLEMDAPALSALAVGAQKERDAAVLSLLQEVRCISGQVVADEPNPGESASGSSLTYLRLPPAEALARHQAWIEVLHRNMADHQPLTQTGMAGLPELYDAKPPVIKSDCPDIADLFQKAGPPLAESDRRPTQETIETALERLSALDLFESAESRHASSLSPIAYLRKWRLAVRVRSGRNRYDLTGVQTSYGRGLSPESARASCLMEIVERVSSFVSVEETECLRRKAEDQLVYGSLTALAQKGVPALDPNRMRLEVPYGNERLYWIKALTVAGKSVYVPAQAVFLFANLDEPSLFSSLGSTGLASGNTLPEARLAGLFEVVERDADGVMPFDAGDCFELGTDNPHLAPLFEAYKAQGIAIGFQEITTEFGIPCFRCFVRDGNGAVIQGTGAHLDGRKAALSALTETTYPFPSGPPSAPGLAGLPRRRFEDLPNYDTNSTAANLEMVETLFADRGFDPLYVDLTRDDIGIPVSRALVPGLEWLSDFDRFATVSPRLYANCLTRRHP